MWPNQGWMVGVGCDIEKSEVNENYLKKTLNENYFL